MIPWDTASVTNEKTQYDIRQTSVGKTSTYEITGLSVDGACGQLQNQIILNDVGTPEYTFSDVYIAGLGNDQSGDQVTTDIG